VKNWVFIVPGVSDAVGAVGVASSFVGFADASSALVFSEILLLGVASAWTIGLALGFSGISGLALTIGSSFFFTSFFFTGIVLAATDAGNAAGLGVVSTGDLSSPMSSSKSKSSSQASSPSSLVILVTFAPQWFCH